jgi:hypothetical protein
MYEHHAGYGKVKSSGVEWSCAQHDPVSQCPGSHLPSQCIMIMCQSKLNKTYKENCNEGFGLTLKGSVASPLLLRWDIPLNHTLPYHKDTSVSHASKRPPVSPKLWELKIKWNPQSKWLWESTRDRAPVLHGANHYTTSSLAHEAWLHIHFSMSEVSQHEIRLFFVFFFPTSPSFT